MTRADQIPAVAKLGFTERQAGFLVTVLVHAGVCVGLHRADCSRPARWTAVLGKTRSMV
ncbi:MAG TPA: hypothetical protein VI485_23665 [Vicinamibacterales bacterium]|nr:hypothetical protein [Vicinamibacterales bacterium]